MVIDQRSKKSAVLSLRRRLHEASRSNADARPAIQMFCYSIRKQP